MQLNDAKPVIISLVKLVQGLLLSIGHGFPLSIDGRNVTGGRNAAGSVVVVRVGSGHGDTEGNCCQDGEANRMALHSVIKWGDLVSFCLGCEKMLVVKYARRMKSGGWMTMEKVEVEDEER